jgi:hypothetical protein
MNFSNIYRDYLTNLVENQTSKKDEEKSREQTELDEEKHIIAFIKAARDIYISKNALSRQDRDTLIQIAQKYLGGTPEEYEPFTEKIPENSPIRVSAICGNRLDLAVDEHVFGAILDYLGVFDTKRGECIDKFKSEREEALKRKNELDTKIFTEFKKFYNLEKKKATEAGASGKVINREQLEKAMSKLEAFSKNPDAYDLIRGFFASIDPSLAWMDQTFVQDSSKFIYASELQPERWVKMVIQIEQEVIANGSINAKPKDAKEQFKDIIEGCVKLEQEFNKIMEDRELQGLANHNDAVMACLRNAGGIVSGMSLTLGAFTYALGAFIPGGAYYAQYLAKLVKWGRRAGKLISNSGSPLDNAESKKRKIHTDTDEDAQEEKEDVSVKHSLKHKHDIKKEEEENQEEGTL